MKVILTVIVSILFYSYSFAAKKHIDLGLSYYYFNNYAGESDNMFGDGRFVNRQVNIDILFSGRFARKWEAFVGANISSDTATYEYEPAAGKITTQLLSDTIGPKVGVRLKIWKTLLASLSFSHMSLSLNKDLKVTTEIPGFTLCSDSSTCSTETEATFETELDDFSGFKANFGVEGRFRKYFFVAANIVYQDVSATVSLPGTTISDLDVQVSGIGTGISLGAIIPL